MLDSKHGIVYNNIRKEVNMSKKKRLPKLVESRKEKGLTILKALALITTIIANVIRILKDL